MRGRSFREMRLAPSALRATVTPMRHILKKTSRFLAPIIVATGAIASLQAAELNIYSHRHYGVDAELAKAFTEKTGIKVNVQSANADQLIERIKSEGANSPADLFVTVDVARIQRLKADGLLQPVKSEVIDTQIPAPFRDPEGYWIPYTIRARIIVASKERVKAGEIETYEDLADPKWEGRLLIRSADSTYNQSLLASIIAANGAEKATAWAKGVVKNMARPPQGGDREQIKGVASGLADIAVTNTYYLGMLLNSKDPTEREAAKKVTAIFPNQEGRGTHFNVGAVGVLKSSKNVENAVKYLEFLLSPESQKKIANGTYEFPANLDPSLSEIHQQWGKFKPDAETFPKLGENLDAAVKIFDEAGWK